MTMSREEQMRIPAAELSARVLGAPAGALSPQARAYAVRRWLQRRRPALAGAITVEAAEGGVLLRAEGEVAEARLREARELLRPEHPAAAAEEVEIEVDAAEFAVETTGTPEPEPARREPERLRSEVRYFPYPTCEWFEISTGELVLTERRVRFEPRLQIVGESGWGRSGEHEHPLEDLLRFWRGEWWDVPCLMLQMPQRTYRYGWPARRQEPGTIFEVDEWLSLLRSITGRWE